MTMDKFKLLFVAMVTIFFSCNQTDFTNPEEVIKGFKQFVSKDENGKLYDEYLSEKSKEFVTKDEFIKDRMQPDSVLKGIKTINKKVSEFSVDVNYPTYRRFKVDEIFLLRKDTFKSRSYYSLINENGKWKVIWTHTLYSFADQKSFDGDCAGARKTAEKIIEINPFDGSAYDLLATCYYRDNSLPKDEWGNGIVKNIKYALTLEEDCSNHYNTLACYYSSIKAYDLAIQSRLNAIQYCLNEQDKTVLYSNIGNSYIALGKYDDATIYLKKAVDIDPTFPDVWYRFGMLMESRDSIDKAMNFFQQALSLRKMENVLQGGLYSEYAKCCYKQNKCDTAKYYIEKALLIDPSNESYQYLNNVIQYCNNNR